MCSLGNLSDFLLASVIHRSPFKSLPFLRGILHLNSFLDSQCYFFDYLTYRYIGKINHAIFNNIVSNYPVSKTICILLLLYSESNFDRFPCQNYLYLETMHLQKRLQPQTEALSQVRNSYKMPLLTLPP